jgi:hypothetical protein
MKTENGGSAARAVDDPVRVAQDRYEVLPLNRTKAVGRARLILKRIAEWEIIPA